MPWQFQPEHLRKQVSEQNTVHRQKNPLPCLPLRAAVVHPVDAQNLLNQRCQQKDDHKTGQEPERLIPFHSPALGIGIQKIA